MRKIKIPDISQEDVCDKFKNLKYRDIVLENDKDYEKELNNVGELYDRELEKIEKDKEYLEYMKKMYSERFSNKQYTNIYQYYRKIRSSQKICPYCNYFIREVRQLDHFLPKSIFPSLAITVKNLVPICKDCNELKGDYFSKGNLKQLIHPYYGIDIEEISEFLKCKIIEQDNIGFKFYINKLDEWDSITFENVKFHFEKLKLDELYLADFQSDFNIVLDDLKGWYKEFKDEKIVLKLLKVKVDTYKGKIDMPWRYVGFNSLINNEWFLNIYLKNIFKNSYLREKATIL